MVVQHNMTASNASRMLNLTNSSLGATQEELSSGYKINRSSDDAAGLSISEKMRKQIRGLDRASTNIQDGISLVQVADGALTETHDMLQRMNELCVQAANGTNSETDRKDIQYEISQLRSEIDRIAKTTNFNGDIYPLNADTTIKEIGSVEEISLPDIYSFKDVKLTNDYNRDIYVNGVTVAGGETITVKDALFAPYFYNGSVVGTGFASTTQYNESGSSSGGGIGNFALSYTELNSSNISDINLDGQPDNISMYVSIGTKASLKVDENNNIYENDYAWNDTFYLTDKGRIWANFIGTKEEIVEQYGLKLVEYTTVSYPSISFTHIDGRQNDKLFLQTTNEANEGVTVQGVNATAKALGVDTLDITTEAKATAAIDTVGEAIKRVSEMRSYFGAVQNRLEHSVKNVDNVVENTQAAESRIRDTDMADAMVRFSKDNILMQAGQSMLAQANTDQQSVMSLLQ
ncbi:flagellin [Pseudobutyrivibrio sp. JW11]|uniref:flagellin N-terminal helical domain-containing protein n=1 Tax=Pseudobutyrivibrio sp. JW11 TaxID=1855302 RepID=UPI0008DF70B7|nr:flagellin [Pseudobutyrivibrio sp. JW11]SFO64030.1 flagellin [Pseudobutyrivibrio sp. JW11]